MNNSTIREILKTKTMLLTRAEIEAIMNEELEKDVDEMDTEIVTFCLEALTGKNLSESEGVAEKETNGTTPAIIPIRKNKNKTIKIILVAAILISLMLLTVSVGADVMNINVSDKILEIRDNFFKVDLNGEVESTDLKTVLFENELEHLVLPKCLYDGFEISGFRKVDEEDKIKIYFNFINNDTLLNGNVSCWIYKTDYNFLNGKQKVDDADFDFKEIIKNEFTILVFSDEKSSDITYKNKNIEYKISLVDTNLEKAIKVAETI